MKVLMIDPPSGHFYGFPKVYDNDDPNVCLVDWLVANNYPVGLINKHGDSFAVRMWEVDDEVPSPD